MAEKLGRVLEIISRLDRQERVNPEFLAKKLGVSIRTIYRDLELISSAHFPIYYDRAGKTYRFLKGFSLRRLNLSKEEIRILLLSQRLFTRLAEPFKRAADKLLKKLMESGESQLKLDFDKYGNGN
jgi:predicted DNA-binding transcriptional regulator YafY